jgi:glycosyltransferase involved in cell wall biosynthesis
MVERVILVHSDRGRIVDGIRDHSQRLAQELSRQSIRVELRSCIAGGGRGQGHMDALRAWRELRRSGEASVIVLQYSPFCFARWGFAPWLPACLLTIKASRSRPMVALMVHEPYVPMISWRWALMGLWQRLQLSALRLAADVVFTSIDPWAKRFEAQLPKRPVHHLPVGSNFPDSRSQRHEERRRMGIDDDTLVVATMGRDHPAWLSDYVAGAANAIAGSGRPLALLSMGAEAPTLSSLDPSITVHTPGYLESGELACKLAAADLFLAPLIDGISTRRGTVMVALQHALPVVGTAGPLTDPILRESNSALRLTQVGNKELFANAAVRLADDPHARASTGAAARLLYERNFDWPVIVRKLLAGLPER